MSVQEGRRAPFCWQGLAEMRVLDQLETSPQERLKLVGFYCGLTRAASANLDGHHEGFVASIHQVVAWSGLSENTVRRYAKKLEDAGLLRRDEQQNAAGGTGRAGLGASLCRFCR